MSYKAVFSCTIFLDIVCLLLSECCVITSSYQNPQPYLSFFVFIFVGHGFEPIIFALHLREMNRQEEPLAVGEVWEEHSFTFLLEEVTELFQDEWQASIPELHYLTMDEMTGSAVQSS